MRFHARRFHHLLFVVALLSANSAVAQHRVLMQGKNKLAIVGVDGEVEWEMKWSGIHDLHVLENGHLMVQRNMQEVVEIDPETKEVVWSYDAAKQNGNEGKKLEVHAFQPLADGHVMIAESGPARIIEINREGEIQKEFKLKVDNPHPHTDTRLARKLDNGHYLVCHERDGTVREYDDDGKVVWEYEVPMFGKDPQDGHGLGAFGNKCFSAVRLDSGNTLIGTGNGHSVIEVTPDKKIVWQLHQNDLPGIQFAWVTTLEVLPNGNYVIGNCHAGPDNPLLVEIEPKTKNVVWQFDRYDLFGNAASNSRILPAAEARTFGIGDKAPKVEIAKWIKGTQVDAFQTGKVYVVEFWATWCGPCLRSMPHMSELQAEYGDRVHFLGITNETDAVVEEFLAGRAKDEKTWNDIIQYTLAVDDNDATGDAYMLAAGLNGIPQAFIVGKDGLIEWIGHPARIDDPLRSVVTGTWDRVQEGIRYEQNQLADRLLEVGQPKIAAAFQAEEWDQALELIAMVESRAPHHLATKRMKMTVLQAAERTDELLNVMDETIKSQWEYASSLDQIAWGVAAAKGDKDAKLLELAMAAAKRAVDLTNSKDASSLDTLARVHYELGDLDTALEIEEKAIEIEPLKYIQDALEKYKAEKAKQ